jgi:hypothetical protein
MLALGVLFVRLTQYWEFRKKLEVVIFNAFQVPSQKSGTFQLIARRDPCASLAEVTLLYPRPDSSLWDPCVMLIVSLLSTSHDHFLIRPSEFLPMTCWLHLGQRP